jgi:hypothetical protein
MLSKGRSFAPCLEATSTPWRGVVERDCRTCRDSVGTPDGWLLGCECLLIVPLRAVGAGPGRMSAVAPPSSAASNPFGGDTTAPAQPQGLRVSAQ